MEPSVKWNFLIVSRPIGYYPENSRWWPDPLRLFVSSNADQEAEYDYYYSEEEDEEESDEEDDRRRLRRRRRGEYNLHNRQFMSQMRGTRYYTRGEEKMICWRGPRRRRKGLLCRIRSKNVLNQIIDIYVNLVNIKFSYIFRTLDIRRNKTSGDRAFSVDSTKRIHFLTRFLLYFNSGRSDCSSEGCPWCALKNNLTLMGNCPSLRSWRRWVPTGECFHRHKPVIVTSSKMGLKNSRHIRFYKTIKFTLTHKSSAK